MKLFVKLLIFILVLGLAGPFIMKGPDGKPLMNAKDLIPDFAAIKRKMQDMLSDVNDSVGDLREDVTGEKSAEDGPNSFGKTRVYRWQDENGNWQFSDEPPLSAKSETLLINPDVNIVQATKVPKQEPEAAKQETDAKDSGIGLPLPLTVSPGEARKLIEDAKGVSELMQQRQDKLDSITGD